MAPDILVYSTGLGAITIYIEAGQFGQILLATVATVFIFTLSISSICSSDIKALLLYLLLHVYLPVSMRPIVSGCRKSLRNTFLHADAIVIDSRNVSIFLICLNSHLNTRHACLRTVTFSLRYVSSTRLLSKIGSGSWLSYYATYSLPLLRTHLIHPVIWNIGNGTYVV